MSIRSNIALGLPVASFVAAWAAAVMPLGWSGEAAAAAFQLRENSTVSLGLAFAGAGSAADTAATAFNNPAGLTQLEGFQTYGGSSLIAPSFTFHGTATNALGEPISGHVEGDGGHPAQVPYGYASYRINNRLAVGLALTAPFGLSTYYGADFVGRYQADKTLLSTIDINPNIAFKVTDWLSVGAGFSAQRATAEFASQIDSPIAALGATGQLLPLPDGLFRLRDSGNWGYGYNLGVLFTIDPSTRIGLTYRSRIKHNLSGTAQFNVPFPLSLSPALASGPAHTSVTLPDTATISATHLFTPRLTGYADVAWTDWSVFKSLDVYRNTGQQVSGETENYANSVLATVGAAYAVTPRLAMRGGLGFDVTPVLDRYRTARVPDGNRLILGAGGSYAFTRGMTLDAAYSHVFVDNASIDEPSATDDVLAGHFDSHIDIVSLGIRTSF